MPSSYYRSLQNLFKSITSHVTLLNEDSRRPNRRRFQQSILCWLASAFCIVVAGVILNYIISSQRSSSLVKGRLFYEHPIGSCEETSNDVRGAIDYYEEPCEDFYAYACPGKNAPTSRRLSVVQSVQERLSSGSVPYENQTAIEKASAFYRSCLQVSLMNSTVKNNVAKLFNSFQHARRMMLETSTPEEILDLISELSFVWGVGAFLVFSTDTSGRLVISVDKPVTKFISEEEFRTVLLSVVRFLKFKPTSEFIQKFSEKYKELTSLQSVREETLEAERLQALSGNRIRTEDWIKVINAHAPSARHLIRNSSVILRGFERVKNTLNFFLGQEDFQVSTTMMVLHASLPRQFLEALNGTRESPDRRCFGLTRDAFQLIWSDVVIRSSINAQTLKDMQFMTTALVVTLKRLVRQSSSFHTANLTEDALKTLDGLHFNLPRERSNATLDEIYGGLADVNISDFYSNILQINWYAHADSTQHNYKPPLDPEVPSISYNGDTIEVSAASISAPNVCYGHPKILNYATIAVDIAEKLIDVIETPFSSPNVFAAKDIYSCSARLVKRLRDGRPTKKLLGKIVKMRAAFEVVKEASKLESQRETTSLLPADTQTFMARYCQKLCNSTTFGRMTARIWCNSVMMAVDEFVTLFHCTPGQRLVTKRTCTVFA